ncbi:MAG: efflux RND transporter permease subunit [Cyanobacteriota/Melainabacteria group bacterium]
MRSLKDLENAVVTIRENTPVLLKHIARVQVGSEFKLGDTAINGHPGVYIYVTKQPGVNSVKLDRGLQKALNELKASLPEDVRVLQVFNQSKFIERSIRNVVESISLGALLVVVILIVFLLNWRTSVISLTAIPLSIITALIAIKFTGGTINTMSLGGLAIAVGEVVDDAIIDVENVYRRLMENQSRRSPDRFMRWFMKPAWRCGRR